MALEKDIALFSARLDAAIAETLENDVAEAIKDEMSEHLESYEYTRSRGPLGGGVRDRRNFTQTLEADTKAIIGAFVLQVKDEAEFQTDEYRGISLAEAVETGSSAYRMPRPRPFLMPTQETMINGAADELIANGLAKRGFAVSL